MLEGTGGGGSVVAARNTVPSAPSTGPDKPTTAQPYEGLYQADQAAAEKAFNDAQTQLNAQKQGIYADYGLDANGQYNGDIYSQWGQMEHTNSDQAAQLKAQDEQFRRDQGIAVSDNQHGYDTTLSGLGTSESRLNADSGTSLDRLNRDYGLQTADFNRQQDNIARDYGLARTDALNSYGNQLDSARAASLGRGFSGGLGVHPSQLIASQLARGLQGLDINREDSTANLDRVRTGAANSYGDSTYDVRTQLARGLEDIGTQKTNAGYDFNQRAQQLANSLADETTGHTRDVNNLDYTYGLNKSNLGSGWAQALANNASSLVGANNAFSQAKIDARTKYATQGIADNQANLKQLLAAFGL